MRLERKRKEHVACLYGYSASENIGSPFSRARLFNLERERDKWAVYVYHRYGRVDHLIKITRAGCWPKI